MEACGAPNLGPAWRQRPTPTTMKVLNQIAHWHGQLSDFRAVWWPFVFLKPRTAKDRISQARILAMTPCFAAWFLIVWLARGWLFEDRAVLSIREIGITYGYFVAGFFVWFNVVTAPLWNHRARLSASGLSVTKKQQTRFLQERKSNTDSQA